MVQHKIYLITIAFLMLWYTGIGAQSTMSLEECMQSARENYPLYGNFKHIEDQLDLRLKNLNANYYPQLDLNAQASHQNDVPHIESSNLPFAVPQGPKDQYKASVDIQQVIFDAGRTKVAKEVEQVNTDAQKSSLEVELYKIRSKVIQTYFLILTIDEQIKLIEYKSTTIEKRLQEIESAVANGMILASQADYLKVEVLTIKQELIRLSEGKKAALKIMETLTGKVISENTDFVEPTGLSQQQIFIRPEYKYFNDQRQQISVMQKMNVKERLPYVAGFGQFGYGNPGFNMLKDQLAPFYIIGIKLKWNIWDWKQTSRIKQYFQIQSNRIDLQQSVFDMNIDMASRDVNSKINQMQKIMDQDDEIIQLRKRITASSTSQLNNGTITASDYLNDLNMESIALLSKKLHQLELVKSQIELVDLKGSSVNTKK
ncbi:TolC family protein [Plebeiibacterium sediminum]|uniref:TolC family protein n=1 Tax=Plebeiibacterium sediminum TaxID=2992112 RepID=A0AAE3M5Q4_9BACT|nr:TolC family protein [Plebeiobacterium sediminum]MCW3787431.1 TolC family protein [Plebeiobacterium sediminum]